MLSDKEQRHAIVSSYKGHIQQPISHLGREKKALRNLLVPETLESLNSAYSVEQAEVSLAVAIFHPLKVCAAGGETGGKLGGVCLLSKALLNPHCLAAALLLAEKGPPTPSRVFGLAGTPGHDSKLDGAT